MVANGDDLFSSSWYRVSDLKISLHQHTKISRHVYRDVIWHVLQNHISGQSYRFNSDVYRLITLMDGKRSLQQIWELCFSSMADNMPTQEDIIQIVMSLYLSDIIKFNDAPDIEELFLRQKKQKKQKILQYFKSPLSIKIPVFDPERFLTATAFLIRPLFHPLVACIWLVFVLYGIMLAGIHWDELNNNMSDKILTLENILLAVLVYPVVKCFHELGHAYSVKYWGGEVHEIGIMFLVFYPVPYVDASASTVFENKYQRMLVAAAGIMVELFIAAIAMILWTLSEPGLLRAILYNVLLITGVSTVIFNGNPLLKFDAYFVLSDGLEIPNLAQKSAQYIAYLLQHHIFAVKNIPRPELSKGEAKWLIIYGVASYLYRLSLMITIALFIAGKYFVLGVLLAVSTLFQGLLLPMIKGAYRLWSNVKLAYQIKRFYLLLSVFFLLLFLLLFIIPFPYASSTQGVVLASENASLRTTEGGFVSRSFIENGISVKQGDLLLELDGYELGLEIQLLQFQLEEIDKRIQASYADQTTATILQEEKTFLIKRLIQLKQRKQRLRVFATKDGTLVKDSSHLLGRYIYRGELLGQVIIQGDGTFITALIASEDIDYIRQYTNKVELKFASELSQTFSQQIVHISPAALNTLPSDILSIDGGGEIATNTTADGEKVTFRKYFHIDIKCPENRLLYPNERVHIVFRHPAEPLYLRLYRGVRRFFLRYFDV